MKTFANLWYLLWKTSNVLILARTNESRMFQLPRKPMHCHNVQNWMMLLGSLTIVSNTLHSVIWVCAWEWFYEWNDVIPFRLGNGNVRMLLLMENLQMHTSTRTLSHTATQTKSQWKWKAAAHEHNGNNNAWLLLVRWLNGCCCCCGFRFWKVYRNYVHAMEMSLSSLRPRTRCVTIRGENQYVLLCKYHELQPFYVCSKAFHTIYPEHFEFMSIFGLVMCEGFGGHERITTLLFRWMNLWMNEWRNFVMCIYF